MSETESREKPTTILSRDVLSGSRRVTRQSQPLIRNQGANTIENKALEVPIPAAGATESEAIRVLHVDDNQEWLELAKTFLKRTDVDFQIVGETSVVAALDRLRTHDFDCIISDYDMPTTDGLEFLTLIREQHPDLPFFLYTGKGSEKIASRAISAGVTDYVQKRGGRDQYDLLANRIENAVDRYRAQQQFWEALSWYQRLVEQDLAGVFIVQDGDFVYVNKRFARIFGYSQTELIDESIDVILNGTDADELLEWLETDSHREETARRELSGVRSDGSEIRIEIQGGGIQYDGEQGSIGIVWDQKP